MIETSLTADVDAFLLELEEQAKRLPLAARRITGANNRLLGLYLLKRDPATPPNQAPQPLRHDDCEVTAEERLQLFRS